VLLGLAMHPADAVTGEHLALHYLAGFVAG
jgi:hypothetical protein